LRDQQLERELNYDALLCGILAARICADGGECGRLVQYRLVEKYELSVLSLNKLSEIFTLNKQEGYRFF
jgi:hypothetical protein